MTPSHHTILLVEDDENDVLLMKRAFQKANILNPIQVVGDGESALSYLGNQQMYADRNKYPMPVLILLDLKLPRKSGLEVLAWVKGQESLKRVPVVVLTSSKESVDVGRAYDLGVNSYLVKPVEFDDLLYMVTTLNMYWLILNEKPSVDFS
jgi:CheY-like chemotaxis protein